MARRIARFEGMVSNVLASVLTVATMLGCTSDTDGTNEGISGITTAALTESQQLILGFENPSANWSRSGGSISASTTVTQGNHALSTSPSYWTEITSVPLSAIGPVTSTLKFDLRVPAAVPWGEARAIIMIQSLGVWQDVGGIQLSGLLANQYQTLSFALPPATVTALNGTYNDLRIRIVLNAPPGLGSFLLDNLVLTETTTPDPGPGAGPGTIPAPSSDEDFFIHVPVGVALSNTFISTSTKLSLMSQVTAGEAGAAPVIANFGTDELYMQAQARANANVYSFGQVRLDAQTRINGFLRTDAPLIEQGVYVAPDGTVHRNGDAPVIVGGVQPGPVEYELRSWSVSWPINDGPDVVHYAVNTPVDIVLPPGAYGNFDVHDSNRVHLSSGTYYFGTFNLEPLAELHLDTSSGPVIVYVRNDLPGGGLRAKARIFTDAGPEAQFLLGFRGTGDVFLQGPFQGTVVAPHAKIKLERPNTSTPGPHKGSFFAKDMEFAAGNHTVHHVAFQGWETLFCALGDTDGDGVSDCDDLCPNDPEKSAPGICNCGVSEEDTDGDGIPDCAETCDNDPGKQRAGYCGCSDSPVPAGTPCVDLVCGVASTCDGAGRCGSATACTFSPGGDDCTSIIFENKVYWVCEGPRGYDEARAHCESFDGFTLAAIDTQRENALLSSVLGEREAWFGGRAAASGIWSWEQAQSFYATSTAARLNRSYLNWDTQEPASNGCLKLNPATGTWHSESCNQPLGAYVCERPRQDVAPPPHEVTCVDFFGEGCEEFDVSDTCVPVDTVFIDMNGDPLDGVALDEYVQNCAQCPEGGGPGCEYCVGALSIPPPGSTCDPFSQGQRGACALVTYDATTTCETDDDCNGPDEVCADVYTCSVCPEGGNCTNTGCSSSKHCGVPATRSDGGKDCANDDGFDERCDETPWTCAPDNKIIVDTNPFDNPGSNVEPEHLTPEDVFGQPVDDEPTEYPADPACVEGVSCGSDQGPLHPWCRADINDPLAPKAAGDEPSGGVPNKRVSAGQSGLLSFQSDPGLALDFNVSPGAFGELNLSLAAKAKYSAAAQFNFGIAAGNLELVNASVELMAERCGISSNVVFKIFGDDILPMLIDDPDALNFEVPAEETQQRCKDILSALTKQLHRVKKALRDAQELLRQYEELRTGAKRFEDGAFCFAVENPPEGFPPGDCQTESPEETINRFIEYYENQVNGAIISIGEDASEQVQGGLAGILRRLKDFGVYYPFDIGGPRQEELWQIASAQFFLGPIPMTLQVESFVNYGLYGELTGAITPSIPENGNPEEFAYVYVKAVPTVSAGISLFVGAGFSAGPFEASAGVDGKITLGEITMPAHAKAGFYVTAEDDLREIPGDHAVFFPPGGTKRYAFELNYDYGLRLTIPKILSGSLGASVRVRFLFFSKRWRAELLRFEGFPVGNDPFFDREIFTGGGTLGRFDWGTVRMPLPLVKLPRLEPGATRALLETSSVDTTQVEELFYDELCVCQGPGDSCTDGSECCPAALTGYNFFSGCALDPTLGHNTCRYGNLR